MTLKKGVRRIPVEQVKLVSTHREQLQLWSEGKNVHVRSGSSWECCPDFSCCYPDLVQTPAARRKFCKASGSARMAMLERFLEAFVDHVSDRPGSAYVVGTGQPLSRRRR